MKFRLKCLWILLALPLALFIYGRRLAGRRPAFLGRFSSKAKIWFPPRGPNFVVSDGAKWAIGSLNGRQLHLVGDIPSGDPDGVFPAFSSDGREFAWLQTTTYIEHLASDGTVFPDFMPDDWALTVYDAATGKKKRFIRLNRNPLLHFAVGKFAWDSSTHQIRVWDSESHDDGVDMGDGSRAIVVDHSQIFDDTTGKRTATRPCAVLPFSSVFAPDGRTATRFNANRATVIDTETGRVLWRWEGTSSIQFSPDGQRALAVMEGQLIARDARNGEEVWRCVLPPVRNWILVPDGESVVEVRADGSIWKWPIEH